MKKLLIVGASALQIPAIIKAKDMGFYVGVIDYNPCAEGVKLADEYFEISTIDIEGILNVAKEFKPNGIMTLATDMPMRAIANACQKLNLPGISIDTAIKATDKGEMIKAFEMYKVEHPWFEIISSQEQIDNVKKKLSYPCIIKPTDNSGSRGVALVEDECDLMKNYFYSKEQSRNGVVIFEEFLQGPEVSVEIMVIDDIPHILAITDKLTTGAPHFVEMGHSQPSRLDETQLIKIRDLACRAVKAVGINCGPAHVEIIMTSNGPKMVELGARMGGDCITTHLVPLSTGIDMVEATIKIACGEKVDIKPVRHKGSAIRYLEVSKGVIQDITGLDKAKKVSGVYDIKISKKIGENISIINSSIDRVGSVIAFGENAEDAITICECAIKELNVITDELNYTKVALRELYESDVNIIYEWVQDDDLRRFTGTKKPDSYATHLKWFEKKIKDNNLPTLIILVDDTPVGLVGANNVCHENKNAEIYIYIGNKINRGVGTGRVAINLFVNKCFEEMKLHKVTSRVFSYNRKSIKLFENCGFLQEGIQVDQISVDGQFYDLLWYGKVNKE